MAGGYSDGLVTILVNMYGGVLYLMALRLLERSEARRGGDEETVLSMEMYLLIERLVKQYISGMEGELNVEARIIWMGWAVGAVEGSSPVDVMLLTVVMILMSSVC